MSYPTIEEWRKQREKYTKHAGKHEKNMIAVNSPLPGYELSAVSFGFCPKCGGWHIKDNKSSNIAKQFGSGLMSAPIFNAKAGNPMFIPHIFKSG